MKWLDFKTNPPTPKGNENIQALVELEEPILGLKVHCAIFHKNVILVGGYFDFDMPTIIKWIPLEQVVEKIT